MANYEPWVVDVDVTLPLEPPLPRSLLRPVVYATVYDAFIHNYHTLSSADLLFRGHTDARWSLQPTKARLVAPESLAFYGELRQKFVTALSGFFRSRDVRAIEAICQHYGFPTEFLDLTSSFDVAAYFASRGYISNEQETFRNIACIWMFSLARLRRQGLVITMQELAEFPINQRMKQQLGAFLFAPSPQLGEVMKSMCNAVLFSRFVQAKPRLILHGASITEATLFPPDEDDDAARAVMPMLRKLRLWEPLFRQLDSCVFRLRDRLDERSQAISIEAHADNPNVYHSLWAIERAVLDRSLGSVSRVLQRSAIDFFHWYQWEDLVGELLLAIVRQGESAWKPDETALVTLGQRLMSDWWSPWPSRFAAAFNTEQCLGPLQLRQSVLSAFAENIMPLRFEDVEVLVPWFWIEPNDELRQRLKGVIDASNYSRNFSHWPPRLKHLETFKALWTFGSYVMVNDLDVNHDETRIVAASSDHNVYVLDFSGKRRTRVDLHSPVLQARFMDDATVVTAAYDGHIRWFSLNPDDAVSLLRDEKLTDVLIDDTPVSIDVDGNAGRLLAGYGKRNSRSGGIRMYNTKGEELWSRAFDESVVEARFVGSEETDRVLVRFNMFGRMRAILFSPYAEPITVAEARLVMLAGIGPGRDPLLSTFQEGVATLSLVSTLDGRSHVLAQGDRVAFQTVYLEEEEIFVSTHSSIDPQAESAGADVRAIDKGGQEIWKHEMTRQTLLLEADRQRGRLYMSGQGQGNVYVASFGGEFLCCSRVKFAPLAFRLCTRQAVMLVASKTITALPRL